MTIFLKKMGIILSDRKPHSRSRHSKLILKIQFIRKKNILGKQLSQAICSKYVFRLLHAPKFQTLSTKLNLMVKSCQTVHRCSVKKPMQEFLFNEVSHLQDKERFQHKCFPVSFTKYFRTLFAKHWVTASAKYPFLRVMPPSATKNVFFKLGYFKYFWDKHSELLANSSLQNS